MICIVCMSNVYCEVGSNQVMVEQTIKRKSKNDTEFECYDWTIDKISLGEYFKSDYLSYQLTVKGEISNSADILIINQAGV